MLLFLDLMLNTESCLPKLSKKRLKSFHGNERKRKCFRNNDSFKEVIIIFQIKQGETMSAHILITGGAGYLGSILCEHLLRAGYRITVVDNLTYGQHSLFQFCANPNFDFVFGDARDEELKRTGIVYDIQGNPCPFENQIDDHESYLALYQIMRSFKPDMALELGFAHGCSTLYMLQGLADNGKGIQEKPEGDEKIWTHRQ
jgi:hypothetical protein